MAKKIIVYGSAECPPCVAIKKRLDDEGIHYGYVDVLAGLAHFKKFIVLRDSNYSLYEDAVKSGSIGIPTLVVDDKDIYIDAQVTALDINVLK